MNQGKCLFALLDCTLTHVCKYKNWQLTHFQVGQLCLRYCAETKQKAAWILIHFLHRKSRHFRQLFFFVLRHCIASAGCFFFGWGNGGKESQHESQQPSLICCQEITACGDPVRLCFTTQEWICFCDERLNSIFKHKMFFSLYQRSILEVCLGMTRGSNKLTRLNKQSLVIPQETQVLTDKKSPMEAEWTGNLGGRAQKTRWKEG